MIGTIRRLAVKLQLYGAIVVVGLFASPISAYDYQKERLVVDGYIALTEGRYLEALALFDEIISHGDGDAEIYFCAGFAEYSLQRFNRACDKFQSAVKIQPAWNEALINLGAAEIMAGKPEQALQYGREVVNRAPDLSGGHELAGVAAGLLNQTKDEVDFYRAAIKLKPESYKTHFNLALAYIRLGWFKEAADELSIALNLNGEFSPACYWLGQVYGSLKMPGEEMSAYEKAPALGMSNAELHYNLGLAYSGAGRIDDEIAQYKKAIALNPDFVDALYNLSIAYGESGKWQESIDAMKQASHLKPELALSEPSSGSRNRLPRVSDLPEKYYQPTLISPEQGISRKYMAENARNAGMNDQAGVFYREAIAAAPDDASLYFALGNIYIGQGQRREAIPLLKELIRLTPEDSLAYLYLGDAYLAGGAIDSAITLLEPKAVNWPENVGIRSLLGICYVSLEKWEKASGILQEAIRLKPDDFDFHNLMGVASMQLRRWDEASTSFEKTIQLKPDFADGHCSLGLVYGSLGKHPEEIAAYKEAIRLKPDMAEAHYGLGLAYLDLRDKESAKDEYAILFNLDKSLARALLKQIKK